MSTKAKVTLASSIVFCIASVTGVHYAQNLERENLRAGVINDTERRRKKEEQRLLNMKELEEQNQLHESLLKTQTVSKLPSNEPAS
ncbi:hypothetical protein BY458DRAFT_532241 [Sporodiniella umbellata]|nr:hypothetical protein BY458DRAFT_532241 [Sporodiniella umbellata]